jgi:hypothetical protein
MLFDGVVPLVCPATACSNKITNTNADASSDNPDADANY